MGSTKAFSFRRARFAKLRCLRSSQKKEIRPTPRAYSCRKKLFSLKTGTKLNCPSYLLIKWKLKKIRERKVKSLISSYLESGVGIRLRYKHQSTHLEDASL